MCFPCTAAYLQRGHRWAIEPKVPGGGEGSAWKQLTTTAKQTQGRFHPADMLKRVGNPPFESFLLTRLKGKASLSAVMCLFPYNPEHNQSSPVVDGLIQARFCVLPGRLHPPTCRIENPAYLLFLDFNSVFFFFAACDTCANVGQFLCVDIKLCEYFYHYGVNETQNSGLDPEFWIC